MALELTKVNSPCISQSAHLDAEMNKEVSKYLGCHLLIMIDKLIVCDHLCHIIVSLRRFILTDIQNQDKHVENLLIR